MPGLSYKRHQRERVIARKVRLSKHIGWHVAHSGMLAKGKIHCSCWMCRSKSYDRVSHSDKKKMSPVDSEWEGFYGEDLLCGSKRLGNG